MGFSRQEYWSGFPRPPPEDLHNSGIKPASFLTPDALHFFPMPESGWQRKVLTYSGFYGYGVKEIWVQSLGQDDSLEKGMAHHSSTPAWRIPWTEETGGLLSLGSQRVRHD